MCDFWARVKLRKLYIDELVQELRNRINTCEEDLGSNLDDTFSKYWTDFGIKNLGRFCEEAPELCSKMKQVEEQVRKTILWEK